MSALTVQILDPGNYTPYYDLNLAFALGHCGWQVKWLTSRFLFEELELPTGVNADYVFFNLLESARVQRITRIRERHRLRRTFKAFAYPLDLLRLDRKLSAAAPGILHVQWALLPSIDAIFWKRWSQRGWKIVFTAHDVIGLKGTTPHLLRDSNRRLYRIADAVVAHSQVERDEVIAKDVSPTRVWHIPQGGPGIFDGCAVTQEEARRELGIETQCPTILFFGLIKAYKGLGVLLASFAQVRKKIPGARLVIAGEPLLERRHIEQMIATHCLAEAIRWTRAFIPSRQVGKYFSAADVLAVPYLAASSSAVLLTAYAHSRPVVATNVGGLTEMVEPNQTGLLVQPNDPDALADALTQLLLEPATRAAMGTRAREYLEANHSWSLIADKTAELYNTLNR